MIKLIYIILSLFHTNIIVDAKYEGSLTAYGDEWRGNNCGFDNLTLAQNMEKNSAEIYFAAINAPQWNFGYECGRCAQVKCTSKECLNRPSLIVMILNQCPECSLYDLDVSDKAFHALTGSHPARYKIEWEFVLCPKEFVNGHMKMHLKEGSNPYFIALQPRNSLQPISKIEIIQNKKKIKMEKPENNWISSFYFLARPKNGLNGRFKVRTTAKDGSTIEHAHNQLWKPGTATNSRQQFTENSDMPSSNIDYAIIESISTESKKEQKVNVLDDEKNQKIMEKPLVIRKEQKSEKKADKNGKLNQRKDTKPNLKSADTYINEEKKKEDIENTTNLNRESELLPLYAHGCDGDHSKCGDYNGHRLICSSYGMCICADEACSKKSPSPSQENKAIQYEECSLSKPCVGHGQKCTTLNINEPCHKAQEKLHCFRIKHGSYSQCLTLTECNGYPHFNCTDVII